MYNMIKSDNVTKFHTKKSVRYNSFIICEVINENSSSTVSETGCIFD